MRKSRRPSSRATSRPSPFMRSSSARDRACVESASCWSRWVGCRPALSRQRSYHGFSTRACRSGSGEAMSWFPNFLSPLTGLIAAVVAVPALLVLYFLKLRRRELAVSSTLLWKKAIQDLQVNAPFQRLRRNLLLLLQMLLLVLLLLALARPVTKHTAVAGKTTVVLI